MEFHRLANIFPMMRENKFQNLKADIGANGLIEPIVLFEGEILDGRNRYNACVELGIAPEVESYTGDDPYGYVLSMNIDRRHMGSGQAACSAVLALPIERAAAKERQLAAGEYGEMGGRGNKKPLVNSLTKGLGDDKNEDKATARVAKRFNTNRTYVENAETLKTQDLELFWQVHSGDIELTRANRQRVAAERKPIEPPTGQYQVIYADPPWSYNDTGLDDYGHAERHYPSMTIEALCELPIKEIAFKNCVLFLWVTSPLLEDSFQVIKAWGFKYKTSFVWDKVKHNFGHYNSVRHEFLLVSTRGRCTPDNPKLVDSVQTIERSETHSAKPLEFRDIIEFLYEGPKIELFARDTFENWESWGNEK